MAPAAETARSSAAARTGRAAAPTAAARAALRRARAWSARNPLAADGALAVGLWLLTALPLLDHGAGAREWLFAFALPAALPWRRRAPVPVFAAVALLAFVQWAAGSDLLLADAAVLIALYTVVAHGSPPWAPPAAFAVGELGALLAALTYTERQAGYAFLSLSALVVAATALGVWARVRRERIAELEERAAQLERERDQQGRLAAAAERARIARELHDVVAHSLTVMVALADGARLTAPSDPAQADVAMRELSATGREALGEMRRLLGVLREEPAGPDSSPLQPQPGIAQLDALLEQVRRTGLDATLTRTGEPVALSPGAELTVYRVVQEALTNTLKHASQATGAAVRLDYAPDGLALEVTDDGGTAPPAPPDGDGRGLAGMRERLAAFGAAVEAGPLPGGGWRVRTRLPLDGASPARGGSPAGGSAADGAAAAGAEARAR